MANNPNPSEQKAQDYKALQLTTHPTSPHPNVLRILSQVLAYLPRGELRLKPLISYDGLEGLVVSS